MRMNLIVSSFLALAATRLMAGSPGITANPQPHSGDPMDSCYMQTFGAFDCGTSDATYAVVTMYAYDKNNNYATLAEDTCFIPSVSSGEGVFRGSSTVTDPCKAYITQVGNFDVRSAMRLECYDIDTLEIVNLYSVTYSDTSISCN